MRDERERFKSLFEEHLDSVLGFAARRVGAEAAKDVAAQTFLVAWRRRSEIPDRPLPWLFAVANRVLADDRRASNRRLRLLRRVGSQGAGRWIDVADDAAERDVVVRAFAALPERDREVLRLVAWDGLSTVDAAFVAGCSPGTFAVRLSRARARLDAALREIDDGPSPRPDNRTVGSWHGASNPVET